MGNKTELTGSQLSGQLWEAEGNTSTCCGVLEIGELVYGQQTIHAYEEDMYYVKSNKPASPAQIKKAYEEWERRIWPSRDARDVSQDWSAERHGR